MEGFKVDPENCDPLDALSELRKQGIPQMPIRSSFVSSSLWLTLSKAYSISDVKIDSINLHSLVPLSSNVMKDFK